MAQINRTGIVSFHDASLHVWEEPEGPARCEWERQFKKDVFLRMAQQLRRLGWHTEVPAEMVEQYSRSFAESRRYCRKGDLQGFLDLSGRHIKLEMWQDVANVDHPSGGRYEFNKEQRMPYLLWLEMERTRRRLRDYLCNVFSGYEFNSERRLPGRRPNCGPGALTALEWVGKDNRSSGHYVAELGHARINMECNARSGDGGTITHGDHVYAIGYDGRIVVGTALYDLNSRWWVVTGKYGVIGVNCSDIFLESPGDLRRKRNERTRRKRLEGELAKAIKAMDFLRAETLKHILFPQNEPLFLIWHKGHGAWFAPDFCGYRNSVTTAGKYTRAELGLYAEESELTRPVPLEVAA